MQRLTLLVTVAILGAWIPGGLVTFASAQDQAKPPEGAVWYDPGRAQGPLIKPNDWTNWRRYNRSAYEKALRSSNPTQAQKDELKLASKIYTNRMTDPEEEKDLPSIAKELLTRIAQFGTGDARDQMHEYLVTDLANLFRQKRLVVRVNAAVVLGRLDTKPAPMAGGGQAVRYWPAYRPLIGAVEDPNQALAVKYRAVRSLQDILALSDIPRKERDDLNIRLINKFNEAADPANWPTQTTKRRFYYQYLLAFVEAIRSSQAAGTLTKDPMQVDALVSVITDARQDWRVRSRAMRALSELPLEDDNTFNVDVIARLAGWLMNEAVVAYEANPDQSHWRETFFDIYLSFRPLTTEQAASGFGWEAKAAMPKFREATNTVANAFNVIVPIMAQIAPAPPGKLPRLENTSVENLKAFVADNLPTGKVHPRMEDLDLKPAAAATEPAADPNGAAVGDAEASDGGAAPSGS